MTAEKIKVEDGKSLRIEWSNSEVTVVNLMKLRRECPCAYCKVERDEESNSFIPIYSRNQLSIDSIEPSGTVGLKIVWGDGHNTGIYEYGFLQNISEKVGK